MGTSRKIRIGILTSSRADFGIYLPLLNQFKSEPELFDINIIAFGTHLSPFHGYTINEIYNSGFDVPFQIRSVLISDDEESIATSYSLTSMKFSQFWAENKKNFDCVLCLGDRYEMAAAVIAGIPFNILFAHFHGGETSVGAIDNTYRHMISLSSSIHFVAAQSFVDKIKALVGDDANCHFVGALSLDDIDKIQLPSESEFRNRWNMNSGKSFILITIHPETKSNNNISEHVLVIDEVLNDLVLQNDLVICMPNSDTHNSKFRDCFEHLKQMYPDRVTLIENFGRVNYFAAMKYSRLMLGNSSSGIIEAASFNKYVINVGNRQKGRLAGENVCHVSFNKNEIIAAVKKIDGQLYTGQNLYKVNQTAKKVCDILKNNLSGLIT